MTHSLTSKLVLAVKIAMFSFISLFASDVFAQLTAKANHDHITVDSFYHGGTVSVSGVSDPGTASCPWTAPWVATRIHASAWPSRRIASGSATG